MNAASESDFDDYAEDYEAALLQGLSVSGEGREYFAVARLEYLKRCLREQGIAPRKAMDFGCGTGESVPLLQDITAAQNVLGIDPSKRTIERAARALGTDRLRFATNQQFVPDGSFDLVYTNGVFHHVPPANRIGAFRFIYDTLRPGGVLSFWENNPWSLGARYVMSRIPFDRDAVMVSARQAEQLARTVGLRVVHSDYHFLFPAGLRRLRPFEKSIRGLPLGAQYQMLCVKP